MNVSVCGFEWETGSAVDVAKFFTSLRKIHGAEREFGKTPRVLFTSKSGNFYTGALVTIRDRRKFFELQKKGGKYRFAMRASDPGSRPMEFNYFIVHPIVKRGLYLHYRGACGLRSFGTLMRKLYNEAMSQQKAVELATLESRGKVSRAARSEISAKFKQGQFFCYPLMSKEKIEQLIDRMSRIRRFSWTYAQPVVKEPLFKSVDSFVTTAKGELSFSPNSSAPSKIKAAITDFIRKASPKRGSIEGLDRQGIEKTYQVQIQPENYETYDWDALVGDEDLDPDNIDSTNAIGELMKIAKRKSALFGK